jgi:dethiobiotin synthetase
MTESQRSQNRAGGRNIVVVSGTDTEIGKTIVACGLVRRLSEAGLDVRAIKPVESGIDRLAVDERDGVRLARAARQRAPERALQELTEPLAPPEAAEIDGVGLRKDEWIERIEAEAAEADLVVVEGAGGLLSPLTWEATARSLAVELGAGVLLVAPDALGVLNHTLLSLEALESAGVPLLGVVFSRSLPRDESTDRNPDTLRRFADIDAVSTLPVVDNWAAGSEHLEAPAAWIRAYLESS